MPLIWLLFAVVSFPVMAERWVIHANGYGPILVGMSVRQVEKLLNTSLMLLRSEMDGNCYIGTPHRGHPGLYLRITHDRVTHVGANQPGLVTDAGLQVGDHTSAIMAHYGKRVVVEPEFYGSPGFYFYVWQSTKQKYGIRYESLNHRIIEIRGGDSTIRRVEGPCS